MRSKSKTRTRIEVDGRAHQWAQNDGIVEQQNSTQELAEIYRSNTPQDN